MQKLESTPILLNSVSSNKHCQNVLHCLHSVFFSEHQYLFPIVPNEERVYVAACGEKALHIEHSAFFVWPLWALPVKTPKLSRKALVSSLSLFFRQPIIYKMGCDSSPVIQENEGEACSGQVCPSWDKQAHLRVQIGRKPEVVKLSNGLIRSCLVELSFRSMF